MPQKLIQTQALTQTQQQRLSQQQMLQVKLLEMPLAELEQNIAAELDDNPALEETRDDLDDCHAADSNEPNGDMDGMTTADTPADNVPEEGATDDDIYERKSEREEREEALDNALANLGSDDEMSSDNPYAPTANNNDNADYEEMVWGDTTSFYDKLKEQMGMLELTDEQQYVMEYMIGSLDDDGILRKPLDDIADELAIYHGIDCSEQQLADTLHLLQTFDPAGIGARSLQECLLLQVERKPEGCLRSLMENVLRNHFQEFTKKHWNRIAAALGITAEQAETVHREILRLNPKPGAALGETMGRNTQQITPDFIIDTDDDGHISFTINHGRLPELRVAPDFADMVAHYRNNKQKMTRTDKEALLYAKEKVEKAQGYIEAIRQRQHTLYVTMKAIIDWQRKFFTDGDEADLKPMILKDIAEKTGLDISTISRVSNQKYAQTRWGTFRLRFFFTDGYVTKDGEEMSTRKIKLALKELIDHEDKKKPLPDDVLAQEMKKRGFPVARRTIAKYREQLHLPVARLRKA